MLTLLIGGDVIQILTLADSREGEDKKYAVDILNYPQGDTEVSFFLGKFYSYVMIVTPYKVDGNLKKKEDYLNPTYNGESCKKSHGPSYG